MEVIDGELQMIGDDKSEDKKSTYDTRAFGDFGWAFVNAGEFCSTLHFNQILM